jgi:predicted transcriptional regulator of viral defense system
MPSASLEFWIDSLQMRGRYSFVRADALGQSGLSAGAVGKALQRAVKSGRLVHPKEYFYVIVPLEYRAAGAPPVSWFIHDLMSAMKYPYYVGLLSAAALHGVSHQQPQMFQVMTDRSVRPVKAGPMRIAFYASKYVAQAAVMKMKTSTGMICVSTPETTVVDLMRFAKAAGHLDHVAAVISELAPLLKPNCLVAALAVTNDIPNAQRLGYILDLVRRQNLADAVHRWTRRRVSRFQPLRPDQPIQNARKSRRWHLLINGSLEIET